MHPLLQEGLLDAFGFVAGALLGWWVGEALGLPLFAEGYGTDSLLAIVLVGLGGGLGVQAARRWRTRASRPPQ